jgi:DNA-binding response OmpR family regulator
MRILVIEDEYEISSMIKRGLSEEGYAVDTANDSTEGEYLAETVPYDLIILDVILPKKNGFEICASLRLKQIKTRILMLTCRDSVNDRVKGLNSGADDYMVKPFDFSELSARIRALLRRELTNASPVIKIGNLSLNTITREVKQGERNIELTSKEFVILEYFVRNPGKIITRHMLEEHAWNLSLDSESNLIEAYIWRLRSKLNEEEDNLIETIRGAGYRLKIR